MKAVKAEGRFPPLPKSGLFPDFNRELVTIPKPKLKMKNHHFVGLHFFVTSFRIDNYIYFICSIRQGDLGN